MTETVKCLGFAELIKNHAKTAFQIADYLQTHKTVKYPDDYKWVSVDVLKPFFEAKEKRIRELEETCKILSDSKLMNAIRKARTKGSKSSPYKPLVMPWEEKKECQT